MATSAGALFEEECDFVTSLDQVAGYTVENRSDFGCDVFFGGKVVAHTYKKYAFYKFLKANGVNWEEKISAQLLPDDAIVVISRKTLHIVEIKSQDRSGSVDEKLQTCDFKRKQYQKLVKGLGLSVAFIYVLRRSWFDKPKYQDVFDYIESVNCNYCFDRLPLEWLGLPVPEVQEDQDVDIFPMENDEPMISCPHGRPYRYAPASVIKSLPKCQGALARHKCPVCAYNEGKATAQGLRRSSHAVSCKHEIPMPEEVVKELPPYQGGKGRHTCCFTAYQVGLEAGAKILAE